jgi:pimeloyl-ACP methyl ester carboxylesterase
MLRTAFVACDDTGSERMITGSFIKEPVSLKQRPPAVRRNGASINLRFPTLDVPSPVLWGAKDRWIPPAHADEFTRRIPGARSNTYAGLGHIPMEEAPEQVQANLKTFLSEGCALA